MKLYDNEDAGIPKANTCCSLDDVEDARSVAYRLGMPYYVFNLKDKFAECVIDRFVDAYEHGVTPNPCIDCNRYLKFDKLFRARRYPGLPLYRHWPLCPHRAGRGEVCSQKGP